VLLGPLLALVVASVVDLRKRQIPDSIPLVLMGWAVATTALGVSSHGWLSLVLGLGFGFAIGALLFWLGGFGGGDAKLLTAMGAVLGVRSLPAFLFYASIAGGVLAAIAVGRGQRQIPYAPAMALGFFFFIMMRGMR
jgi:Flp pilus assembly protein protease CpaA